MIPIDPGWWEDWLIDSSGEDINLTHSMLDLAQRSWHIWHLSIELVSSSQMPIYAIHSMFSVPFLTSTSCDEFDYRLSANCFSSRILWGPKIPGSTFILHTRHLHPFASIWTWIPYDWRWTFLSADILWLDSPLEYQAMSPRRRKTGVGPNSGYHP